MIKPFIPLMTKSELHAVMTGGFATVAGSVLAAYISFGVDPGHLLSASVMSAPAALAFSKLFYPETRPSRTSADHIPVHTGYVGRPYATQYRGGPPVPQGEVVHLGPLYHKGRWSTLFDLYFIVSFCW